MAKSEVSDHVLRNTVWPKPWLNFSDLCPSELKSVGRTPTWTFGEGAEILTTAEVV